MTRRGRAAVTGAPTIARRRHPQLLQLAVVVATSYVEIRVGRRDATQLHTMVSDRVRRQLDALVRRRRRRTATTGSFSLRRVWVDCTHHTVTSIVVLLSDGRRMHPVAMAIRSTSDGLRVVELALPEDHHPTPDDPDTLPDPAPTAPLLDLPSQPATTLLIP